MLKFCDFGDELALLDILSVFVMLVDCLADEVKHCHIIDGFLVELFNGDVHRGFQYLASVLEEVHLCGNDFFIEILLLIL